MRSCASRRETALSTALHSNPLDGGGRVGEHLRMDERELIYDWNRAGGEGGPTFDWSRVRVVQEVGITIEAATFIGSSPIRLYAEDWTVDRIVQSTVEGVTYAVKHGLPVMYVTEDTTRAKPEALKALYGAAIDCGATRICLAGTVGHAAPEGVKALVEFVKKEIVKDHRVKVDWHGHRDRGLGLINCLAAIEAGVDRVHGTALGGGGRVGNAEMDLLIVDLKLLGAHRH